MYLTVFRKRGNAHEVIKCLFYFLVALRTDRDEGDSNYDYKPCYSEIQAQAGFYGDGHMVYG